MRTAKKKRKQYTVLIKYPESTIWWNLAQMYGTGRDYFTSEKEARVWMREEQYNRGYMQLHKECEIRLVEREVTEWKVIESTDGKKRGTQEAKSVV